VGKGAKENFTCEIIMDSFEGHGGLGLMVVPCRNFLSLEIDDVS